LAEAEFPQGIFRLFDARQVFHRDWHPVGNARRQAGRRGPVPRRQSGAPGQFADFGLG
jgi:hypothetical protein